MLHEDCDDAYEAGLAEGKASGGSYPAVTSVIGEIGMGYESLAVYGDHASSNPASGKNVVVLGNTSLQKGAAPAGSYLCLDFGVAGGYQGSASVRLPFDEAEFTGDSGNDVNFYLSSSDASTLQNFFDSVSSGTVYVVYSIGSADGSSRGAVSVGQILPTGQF